MSKFANFRAFVKNVGDIFCCKREYVVKDEVLDQKLSDMHEKENSFDVSSVSTATTVQEYGAGDTPSTVTEGNMEFVVISRSTSHTSTTDGSLSRHSSQATTISKTSSNGEDWQNVDLPQIYRPLSTPIEIKDPETFFRDRGSIVIKQKYVVNEKSKPIDIPGVHSSHKLMESGTFWSRTKEKFVKNQPNKHLAKNKSKDLDPTPTNSTITLQAETMYDHVSPYAPRHRRTYLESDL